MREPEGVPVVRWRCVNYDCRKGYADRSRARRHAAICGKDPANRSCLTCVNFVPGYNALPEEGGGGGPACLADVEIGYPMPRGCPSWVNLGEKP